MGVADYTCSWLITVITLHCPCTLIHLSTVITGDGNHQGAIPNLCPPAVKDYFITACIWWLKTTNNIKLFTNLFVMGPRNSFSLWWSISKLQMNMLKKIKCEWTFWGKSHLLWTSSPFWEHSNVSNFLTTCLSAIMVGSMCSKLALPYRGLLDPLSADQLLGSESDS